MKLSTIAQSKKIRGQGMSEYVIIVALIAVAAIAVTGLFGGAARNQFAGIANELTGSSASDPVTKAKANATEAATDAKEKKGMGSYDGGSALDGTSR